MSWPGKVSGLYDNPSERRVAPQNNNSSGPSHILQEPGAWSEFEGTGIQHSGPGNFSARDIYIGSSSNSERDRELLKDLRVSDPRDDKERIERTKGGLLQESFRWILDHDDFCQWHDDEQSRLLWIKGDPGKGKTMLLCGIINELEKRPAHIVLSYFFCQATDVRLNSATAVVRGLLYLLLDQNPSLIKRLRKKYDHAGKQLFDDVNSWDALSKFLIIILQDLSQQNTYLVIDALDECTTGLNQLLHLIAQVSSSSQTKWLLSSRNRRDIEHIIRPIESRTRLSLELKENAELVFRAVDAYIAQCVSKLAILQGNKLLQDQVQREVRRKADGTFLWVALVVQELRKAEVLEVIDILNDIPTGLDELYERMIQQIREQGRQRPELCRKILSTVTTAYRPLRLEELQVLVDLPPNVPNTKQSILAIAGWSGSFLTIRDNAIYIIHQSAKDFLAKHRFLFPSGLAQEHHAMALKSIQVMSGILQRDMYNLRSPGFSIERVEPPDPNPLAPAGYSCVYWVNHWADSYTVQNQHGGGLYDSRLVFAFLEHHFLHWLEALSLLRGATDGILQMSKLAYLAQKPIEDPKLIDLVRDGLRFIRANGTGIERSPLQVYTSALLFCPKQSIIRRLFPHEEPDWVITKPAVEDQWNACLQTLEGHKSSVSSVAFSRNNAHLASTSWDKTIKIWDTATGQCLQTLKGHRNTVSSADFISDSTQLVSASYDYTLKVWDIATGQCLQTLRGHRNTVNSVILSRNSRQLASASDDCTVKIWDIATGQCLQTLKGHNYGVNLIAYSSDSKSLASASSDDIVKIWNIATGQNLQTLEIHSVTINSIAFSGDSMQLTSASYNNIVEIWNSTTGQYLQMLEGHSSYVSSVVFSDDSMQLASTSHDNTVKVWNSTTGQCLQTLKGHYDFVNSAAFSSDSTYLASASHDCTVKIWDITIGQRQRLKGHSDIIMAVAFSCDGVQLASVSWDKTIKVWDSTTGQCIQTLKGHSSGVDFVAFSSDNTHLASASHDCTVKVWNRTTGQCLQTLEGHDDIVNFVAFSSDGTHLASASYDCTVKVWNSTTGQCLQTYEGHASIIRSVAFSSDNTQLASASRDKTIQVWDIKGQHLQTFDTDGDPGDISLSETGLELYTDIGSFDLRRSALGTTSLPLTDGTKIPCSNSYAVSNDKMWITRNSVNLLWLPPEYRPTVSAVMGSSLAIGCGTGQVLVLRFSEDESLF
ncbi:beta transducin-like protein HET-D2Y [Colletotrichum tofieldiae]|uniref:Beta transducin-like protein HET-D2Y n=1 Tax=Colletotrichum tofieldiae TaxID=708197 RepID=A0A166WKF5_9PEZI|nr:beta transducin-like protein HET-D2Y [Colletotrichum tofieldiae]